MTVALARPEATLDSRYTASEGWVYLTGMQALVRLPMQQRLRDAAAGLNTGGYHLRLSRLAARRATTTSCGARRRALAEQHPLPPGVNEDLAATAIWGGQQVNIFPGAKVDGVFGIWYGKGPGVDRSADVLRHANSAGTSPRAACWRSPATITARNPRPRSISPTRVHRRRHAGPLSVQHPGNARFRPASASPCRGFPAAGSA